MKWFGAMGREMQTKILRTFGTMPPLEANWATLEDGPAWAWWLLAILPLGQHLQVTTIFIHKAIMVELFVCVVAG